MSKISPLFYANLFVDQVQDAKNKFIETFVLDDKVAAPIKQFVEAQRTFTKEVNRSAVEVSDYIAASSKASFEKMKKAV
jgi:hypothetical protein